MRARNPWRPLALTAIGLLPFKWLSPLTGISHEAILSDVLFSAALPCWLIARRRQLVRLRPSPLHLALGAFVVLALASTVANHDRPGARPADFLLVAELVAIAFLTWDLAQSDSTRRLLAAIVAVDAFATLALALVGLGLFYAGHDTSLLSPYGDLTPSGNYSRVAAGFFSGPLMGSWCIFALAIVSWDRADLQPGLRRAAQGALAICVVLSISRAVLGFAVACLLLAAHAQDDPRLRRTTVGVVMCALAGMALLTAGRLHIDPSRPGAAYYTSSDSPRKVLLQYSARAVERHPLLGQGPGALTSHYTYPGEGRSAMRAHITPVNVAATLGIPALLILGFIVGALWVRRTQDVDAALWAGAVGLGLDGLGQDIEHFRHVWVLIGLLAAGTVWRALPARVTRARRASTSSNDEPRQSEGVPG